MFNSVAVSLLVISINRNIVECKFDRLQGNHIRLRGINRNIVECKLRWVRMVGITGRCINRNIVECK